MKIIEKALANASKYFENLTALEENNSFLSYVDCRIKLPVFVTLVIITVASKNIVQLAIIAIEFIILFGLSNITINAYIKKVYLVILFSAFVYLPQIFLSSLYHFIIFMLKVCISISFLVLFSSTTKFLDLLNALRFYKIPNIIIIIIYSVYIYSWTLFRELNRILLARESREIVSKRKYRKYIRERAYSVLGSFFLRVYEKGEILNLAMIARGFNPRLIFRGVESKKFNTYVFIFFSISVVILWLSVWYQQIV